MKNTVTLALSLLLASAGLSFADEGAATPPTDNTKVGPALRFKANDIKGKEVDLAKYDGEVVLFVNVASKCGNTPQYAQLQELHEKYKRKGLHVLGFPANEFGCQEPGTNEEIKDFCKTKYEVDFDMFSKVVVKGEGTCALYEYLAAQDTKPKGAGDISWNFEKVLVGRDGKVAARFAPGTKPDAPEVVEAIEAELKKDK